MWEGIQKYIKKLINFRYIWDIFVGSEYLFIMLDFFSHLLWNSDAMDTVSEDLTYLVAIVPALVNWQMTS